MSIPKRSEYLFHISYGLPKPPSGIKPNVAEFFLPNAFTFSKNLFLLSMNSILIYSLSLFELSTKYNVVTH